MKKYFSLLITLVLIGIITLTAGCFGPKNLPVKAPSWQVDGNGFMQFYTNDSASYGTIYWYILDNYTSPFTSFEAQIKKVSGNDSYGFGIQFAYQDTNNFYRLLIECNGYYVIRKKVSGTYYPILDWTSTTNLNTGLNTVNVIKVTFDGVDTYSVYFNDIFTTSFTDTTFTSGDCCYVAAVGSAEDEAFPNTPVDVRFKEVPSLLSLSHQQSALYFEKNSDMNLKNNN